MERFINILAAVLVMTLSHLVGKNIGYEWVYLYFLAKISIDTSNIARDE
jgi:hypothetical protein